MGVEEIWKRWVRERGTEPPTYCPIDDKKGAIVTGMNMIGYCRGEVVGEFWYNKDGSIEVGPLKEVK